MKFLIVVSLLVAAEAAQLQSYSLPSQSSSSFNHGITSSGGAHSATSFEQGSTLARQGTSSASTSFAQGTSSVSTSFAQGTSSVGTSFAQGATAFAGTGFSLCRDGEVLHVNGKCVVPEVTRNIFAYTVPALPERTGPPPAIPPPRIEHNILFVRLPEEAGGQEPIVVPPPQQNNIVYILKKKSGQDDQKVINLPQPPRSNPEVYYVNYSPGENPTLPGGIDLQTALSNAAQGTGQVISAATSNSFNSFGNGQVTGGSGNTASDFSQTGHGSSGFDFSSSSEVSSNTGSTFGSGNSFGDNSSGSSVYAPTTVYTTPY